MSSILNFATSFAQCIPSSLPPNSHSNASASGLYKLADGTECYHAYPLYLVKYSKATLTDRYLLNPSLNVLSDSTYFVVATLLFILFRFLLSGAHVKAFRFKHAFFAFLARNVFPVESQKVNKFIECLWSQMGTEESPSWVRLLLTQLSGRWYWLSPKSEMIADSVGWPYITTPVAVQWFYLTELAFWCSSMIYIFIETPRKDFFVMLLHHIATCILIIFSYAFSLWKVGQIILLLHDVVDIFLYASKCANYCTFTKFFAHLLFLMFAFTYFIARLVLFPICCVYPIVMISQLSNDTCGVVNNHWQIPGGFLFPVFLLTLVVLHIYWFSLIVNVVWKVILQSVGIRGDKLIEDIRSESGDSEDEDKIPTAKKID
ncbi:longevity-assurance protein (LAG1) domain-containing protein [Cardiosporidium cionae]|uniref:Longevity-assurance protein (LAG1) domain-containing protein n=1 Tax=Cardiosporidium cionae TaxID=476202 RepID=A0ABQ7JET6_9APIC|nr:longevity-assurance protein (LAG1) domain-containing protein [Cardiosporidium cionae]|eukprot:KAF8822469.1 longevity-assurance protein (LAG1) domain-containing protein [Cardiosporidium cionae]